MPKKREVWQLGKQNNMNKICKEVLTREFDPNTGEVFRQHKKQQFVASKFDPAKGYLWRSRDGVKSFFDIPFPEAMSMIDRGRMATLSKHMWGDTNMLGYRGFGRIKPYDIDGIGRLVDLNPKQAELFVRRMQKYTVIKCIPVPFGEKIELQYYVNPLYYFKGPRLSGNLYELFHEEMEKYVPEWVRIAFSKSDKNN